MLNDIFRVQLECILSGVPARNIFFYQETVPTADDDPTALVSTAFGNLVVPKLLAILSDELFATSISCWGVGPGVYAPSIALPVLANGDLTGEALPANAALQFQQRQASFSSRVNGSIFLSGLREADTNGNTWDVAGNQAAIDEIYTVLTDNLTAPPDAGIWSPVTRSTSTAAGGTPEIPVYLAVTSAFTTGIIANQRRRAKRVIQTGT